jgi:hypothetical protein
MDVHFVYEKHDVAGNGSDNSHNVDNRETNHKQAIMAKA